MKPLAAMPGAAELRGLLFDIDDTLTTEGRLTAEAYAAMQRLRQAGKRVVPITGRPAGWCDHIARMWPVDGVVGENGAFYFCFDGKRLIKRYHDAADARERNRARLAEIGRRVLAAVPGSALASDQAYRETDLAIDFCEDVPALPLEAAERIAALLREAGLTAKISSIHVNGWFGPYDKLAMTERLFAERFACDRARLQREYAFIGDSPNDAPMFEFFEHSVGVANLARFAGRLPAEPKYLSSGSAGAGFVELVDRIAGSR